MVKRLHYSFLVWVRGFARNVKFCYYILLYN